MRHGKFWQAAALAVAPMTVAQAQDCNCGSYPFGPGQCLDTCAAQLLNTAPFSETFEVLGLPEEAQSEILADQTSANPPQTLSDYSEATQQAIRDGLAAADPAALERLLGSEN